MAKRPARSWLPHGLIALRERNFVLYVVGQFTSQIGSWIELTAVSWIIYEMTNSPFLLGLVGLSGTHRVAPASGAASGLKGRSRGSAVPPFLTPPAGSAHSSGTAAGSTCRALGLDALPAARG